MGARHDGATSIKPFGWTRVVESGRLGVQLHVSRVNAGTVDPWVVQIALSSFNQKDLEVVVEISQTYK